MFKKITFIAISALIISAGILSATEFNLGISGTKHFKINNVVGPNELKFKSSAPLEEIVGYVEKDVISGKINFDPSNIESASGVISFKVKGMRTGIKTRDKHLFSDDWLHGEKYPDIKFELKKIKDVKVKSTSDAKAVAKGTAVGTYSMHGESKEINVPVEMIYIPESAKTKERANGDFLNVQGEFEVALADFNVEGAKGIVGSKVGEVIQVSFNVFMNSGHGKS